MLKKKLTTAVASMGGVATLAEIRDLDWRIALGLCAVAVAYQIGQAFVDVALVNRGVKLD
jgi:cobalamin biosynthesis protein CbiG